MKTTLHAKLIKAGMLSLPAWLLLNRFDPQGYAGLTQRIFGSISYGWPLVFALSYGRYYRR